MAEKQPATKFTDIIDKKITSLVADVNLLISNGDLEQAIRQLDRGLVVQPRQAVLYKLRGIAYSLKEDYPPAIQNMKKALSLSSGENAIDLMKRLTMLYRQYGELAYSRGDYQLALTNFTKGSELNPKDKQLKLKCVSCLFTLGNSKECLKMVEHELGSNEYPSIELLLTRAKLNLSNGKISDCYHDVEMVLYMNGDNPVAIELMKDLQTRSKTAKDKAMDHSLVGKHKAAIRKFDIAISADPHNPVNHISRGVAYRQLLSYSLAVDEFLLAMDKCRHKYHSDVYQHATRHLVLTYNEFAMHCFRHGYYSDAVVLLNKAIKEEKDEHGLYLNRGDCFFKLKEYRFALADFQQAHTIMKGERSTVLDYRLTVAHYAIGLDRFKGKEFTEAIEHFTQAIRHSPYTARLYTCRARVKHEMKDIQGAKEDTLRSLLLDTHCEDSLPLLARLFPGNTPAQLLQTSEANHLKSELITPPTANELGNKGVDPSPSDGGIPEDISLITVNKHVDDVMDLLYTDKETLPPVHHTNEAITTETINIASSETVTIATSEPAVATVTSEDREHDKQTLESLVQHPRPWSVQLHTTTTSNGNRLDDPSLKEGRVIDSSSFYSSAYFTKKTIKNEIDRILKSNQRFPPRVKLPKTFKS